MTTNDTAHVFERAGLGVAPFRLIGNYQKTFQAAPDAPIQPGASCNYCGTGISDVYAIRSADGREFVVGCECVKKTGDRGLVSEAKRIKARRAREARHAREATLSDTLRARLSDPAVVLSLAAKPHPIAWRAERGDTLADWAVWMLANAGATGRKRVASVVLAEAV